MAEIVDQENTSGTTGIGFGDYGNGRDYLIQGFIPTLNNVTAVSFYITSKPVSGNVGYAVWIDNADTNSNPTGSVATGIGGFTEITNANLTANALTKYTLASSVNLTIGNRYCICVAPWNTSTHSWEAAYVDWRSSTSNPYANGRRVHGNTAYNSFGAPDSGNADIQFRTYGNDSAIKNVNGLAKASVKNSNSLVIASVKSIKGLA